MQLFRTFLRVAHLHRLDLKHVYCQTRRFSALRIWRDIKMRNETMPKARSDPVIMTLDTPEFHSIFTPELKILSDMFKEHNFELRIAGGAVRDILMGKNPSDLDFATDATPDQMKEMFTQEEIRMINTNGEKHGTITARINDKENFEITTLRIEVATDGRHCKVQFINDWKLDAGRRDLTINSMFLGLDGKVYDYFYGYDDLQNRRVLFVGHPAARIQEDYLRILRYFRFYGRIAEDPCAHDSDVIRAIEENVDGLEQISGERIWVEWSKILQGKYSGELTLKMIECGVSKYVGLPKTLNIDHFKEVYYRALDNKVTLRPMTLLSALLQDETEAMTLHMRLKLSAFDRDLALFIIQHREPKPSEKPLKPYQSIILHTAYSVNVKQYVGEVLKYRGAMQLLEEYEKWQMPKFPVTGQMLMPHVSNRRMICKVINQLKDIWLDNNFDISGEELLKFVPDIVSGLDDMKKN